MTSDEKATQMAERNAAICAYYLQGRKLSECASHFKLGRQRIQQVLQQAGVWKPYVKSDRTKFIGVTVSEPTKEALQTRAEAEGVSVSRLVSDKLDAMVGEG